MMISFKEDETNCWVLQFLIFNEPQIETFLTVYVKQITYDNASRVVVVFTFLLCMCLLSSIFLL